jgi:hypothetical protein
MKNKTYENELPSDYSEVLHLNAASKKLGIILNLIALVIMIIVVALAIIPLALSGVTVRVILSDYSSIASLLFIITMIAYIVLHELVHGAAYKALTHQKLTFGITLTCAFCGVPNIYTYRRTALISICAPLVVFSMIFGATTAILYFISPLYYIYSALMLGIHLGGCSGDIYLLLLLSFKYKNKDTLIRDTGPEQFIFKKN